MAKQTAKQMRLHSFKLDLISAIGLLENFELSCQTIWVHEDPAIELPYLLLNNTASRVLNTRINDDYANKILNQLASGETRYLFYCPQVVNFLMEKDFVTEILEKTEFKIGRLCNCEVSSCLSMLEY